MKLYDVTLRDGNHALRHSLSPEMVTKYCSIADQSPSWAIEVGHGNGIGASSFLVGKSKYSDESLITSAREALRNKLLAIHSIPGFSTIERDLVPAMRMGVDVFRIATHVTEADVSQTQIEFLRNERKTVHGVLMMSHMATTGELVEAAAKMKQYGAEAIVFMDSAGHFVNKDVRERVEALASELQIEVGFHAHNNLGLGVSNALSALSAGASLIDGAAMGLGAGAGNAQLETIVAANLREFQVKPVDTNDFEVYLQLSGLIAQSYKEYLPLIRDSSIRSGLAGVFSGYAPQVTALSKEFGIDEGLLWEEIGRRKLVAGQESMIREVVLDLMNL